MIIERRLGGGQDRFTLNPRLLLLVALLSLPLRLGCDPFAIAVGEFFLGQFSRIFGAPGLSDPALPATEDASSNAVSVKNIPGFGLRSPLALMRCNAPSGTMSPE
ncbi:MAG: hypothetical protein IT490_05715 [Candidatus Contendobacter sp.]|nr:hypothetical protein [Candidatus Contendobacter sp.]